jgi:hypothetical protein
VYYCCMFVLKFTRNIAFDSQQQQQVERKLM